MLPSNRPATGGMMALTKFAKMRWAALLGVALLAGCASPSSPDWRPGSDGSAALLKELMARQDKLVDLSPTKSRAGKPIFLLLHGATEDPTEMMPIVREWRKEYDVLEYSYNFHERVETVALNLVRELGNLKAEPGHGAPMTVLVYSYSAIVFREAVILADDPPLFANTTLIQLVPTAGGSREAESMKLPLATELVSPVSKPSEAENPYGSFAEQIWAGEGNKIFHQAIPSSKIHTIIVAGDSHSLADVKDPGVQERYQNGLGTNVLTIPSYAGVEHGHIPANPVVLQYLRGLLK